LSWEKEVKDIKNKRHIAEQMGGKEATDLQHNKGRLTIRERIEGVLDKKSFDEVGKIAGHSEYDTEGTLKNFVPEAHTDYIISVISEEFGVVAIMLILLLFLIFIYMVFKKINFETNDKIKLILIGSISIILMQATIHIGVNIRLFPTTGMTLPFLSYGGSSIVSTSILAGIILNLTKRKIN